MRYMINYKPAFDFDTMLNSIFTPNDRWLQNGPAVNIIEEPDQYRLEAELPGLSENEVEVKIDDRVLTIGSQRSEEDETNREKEENKAPNYLIRERRERSFSRSFVLPKDVDSEKISGSFNNGILTIILEKLPEVKPRKIKVQAA
ncbi:Hsp20/alpha crystallin family protein [Sediminispirochaeta smaragdinae]|uniref:Heat shock protein Hsp20 n=1 Tax=Sediminispirochaeta smaragdinae (strain DSM 11293 / JCM 15392 / SEBR 4228) TaxID=573413 RepID=E1RBA2_SEDSS|nr:Hsp20/alpha crystallin family protein [Sediminispirochaeta smaragdinae]ADK79632.1 heat shock protein Hsp20 [Sediminispirochaeta smaragdinae DSM 11293]